MNNKLYRISQEGLVGGVCAGIAELTGVSVNIVRVLAVLLLFMGFFVVTTLIYFLLVLILDDRPANEINRYNSPGKKPHKQRIQELSGQITLHQQRINALEKYIISSRYEIDKKFKDLN